MLPSGSNTCLQIQKVALHSVTCIVYFAPDGKHIVARSSSTGLDLGFYDLDNMQMKRHHRLEYYSSSCAAWSADSSATTMLLSQHVNGGGTAFWIEALSVDAESCVATSASISRLSEETDVLRLHLSCRGGYYARMSNDCLVAYASKHLSVAQPCILSNMFQGEILCIWHPVQDHIIAFLDSAEQGDTDLCMYDMLAGSIIGRKEFYVEEIDAWNMGQWAFAQWEPTSRLAIIACPARLIVMCMETAQCVARVCDASTWHGLCRPVLSSRGELVAHVRKGVAVWTVHARTKLHSFELAARAAAQFLALVHTPMGATSARTTDASSIYIFYASSWVVLVNVPLANMTFGPTYSLGRMQ